MDEDLERAIDEAGREEVFRRARRLGWSGPVEKWVWYGIIADIKARRETLLSSPPPSLSEELLGFKLF